MEHVVPKTNGPTVDHRRLQPPTCPGGQGEGGGSREQEGRRGHEADEPESKKRREDQMTLLMRQSDHC